MRPIASVSARVHCKSTCGSSSANGTVPTIENQMTRLRPKRSPSGPPRIVPTATAARNEKRRICAFGTETLKRWIK